MKTLRQRYPFSAIVGQEELKQAVLWLHRRTPMFFDSR